MKLRAAASAIVLPLFLATQSSAQSIGLFSDLGCGSCNLEIQAGETRSFFVAAATEPNPAVFLQSASFRIGGLPAAWTYVVVPNAETISAGDPFMAGMQVGFPDSAPRGDCILLLEIALTATSTETDVRLRVRPNESLVFPCPFVREDCTPGPCDILICVGESELFINSPLSCTVPVQGTTWSALKGLYN